MSKKRRKVPAGLPAVKMPEDKPETVPEVLVPETTEDKHIQEEANRIRAMHSIGMSSYGVPLRVLVEDIGKIGTGEMSKREACEKYGEDFIEKIEEYSKELAKAHGESVVQVEEERYQLEQETVEIVLATCPRCGSTERERLKEISPRIPTGRGLLVRYRTRCLGRINPVDKEGKPVVDADGNPVSYECGNRYRVKALVPNVRREAS